jgi:hypothetical protein
MFNRLPGAMLKERHLHECRQGRNCGRALLHHTAAATLSHTLFNPAPPEAGLKADRLKGGGFDPAMETKSVFPPAA